MGKKINLLNQTFDYLTVIEETTKRDRTGSILWKCKCKCGSETLASTADLRSGHKRSCGCLQKEKAKQQGEKNLIDLTGKKFGLLTVLSKDHSKKTSNGSTKVYWKCKCECGNIVLVAGQSLKDKNTQSCGCIKSFGEQKISQILREANLPFEKEKIFKDGITSNGGNMRFDFFVDNKYIIEYDGKQHFQNNAWGSDTLKQIQQRDKEKNIYCHIHHYPVIRIPYTHYLELELKDLLLETTNFLVPYSDEEPAKQVVPVDQSRCGKCVYEVLVCGENDFYGNCPKYKRDPPDGGFYG